MKRNSAELKFHAREAFRAGPGTAVLAAASIGIIQLTTTLLSSYLFPGKGVLNIVMGEVFSLGLTVLACLFEAGLCLMYMNMSRGREFYYGQILWFFRNQPDRVIIASAVMALISWLTNIPVMIYIYTAPVPETQEAFLQYQSVYLILLLVCVVGGNLIMIPLEMTYYLLADEPELDSIPALKKSIAMMKGNIGRYILLQLSFLPWILISGVAMYIPLLYVFPYMGLSNVAFYRDLRGEYDEEPEQIKDEEEYRWI